MLSGALSALAFSNWTGCWVLAWIGLIPAFWWLQYQRQLKAVILGGFLWAAVLHGLNCWWLWSLYPLGWMGLSAPLGLLTAFGAWALVVTSGGLLGCLLFSGSHALLKRWPKASLLLIPFFWMLCFRVYELNPFWIPWSQLAYTQHDIPLMRWITEATGTAESIGFLLVGYNLFWIRKSLTFKNAVLALLLPLVFGLWSGPPEAPLPKRVALLQGNLDNVPIRSSDAAVSASRTGYLTPLSEEKFFPETLVVLPEEGIVPGWANEETPEGNLALVFLHEIAQKQRISILTGLSSYRQNRAFNTLALITSAGNQYYHKRQLVPFGETVPLIPSQVFTDFLAAFGVPYQFVFQNGQTPTILRAPGSDTPTQIGSLVCFELIYPGLATDYKKRGVNLLVNSSNLGWFHENAQMAEQFLAIGQLRAAENGIPLVIAANTGISAVIDRHGRVLARTPVGQRARILR